MIAVTLREQRFFNISRRDWITRHARIVSAVVAVAAMVFILGPRIERHQGVFSTCCNQDVDVGYVALVLRGGLEFRLGGGSLNLVIPRWGYGKELIALHR